MRLVLAISALVLVLAAPAGAAAAGPANRALPTVVGLARVGEQITGSSGTWSGSGTVSYSFQWNRCDTSGNGCAVITGAVLPTYRLTAADVGKTVGLTVTAKDSNGTASASASLVGPIAPASSLASIGRPAISGSVRVGSTLTVSIGIWTSAPSTETYAWMRCNAIARACTAISGAAAPTYVVGASDVAHTLVARVQATAGPSTQATLSLATPVVVAGSASPTPPTTTTTTTTTPAPPPGPSAGTRPAVTGMAKAGQRLTGSAPATVTGAVAYQWYRCDTAGSHCSSIHGAVAARYVLVTKDVGQTIGLTVRVTPTGGTATPSYASLVGPVAAASAADASSVQPAVTGTPMQGKTLTASAGTWGQATPTAVAYAWWRCNANGRICAPIAGAASATYVPVAADVGHALAALVTATFGATTQTALSVATDPIQAPPVLAATTSPTVTGTPKVGRRLTGATGVWTGTAPISYHYQWYRCDSTGAHCASVHGATAATYRIASADAGKSVGLTVTATDGNGMKQPAYASLVGPVAAAPATLVSTVQPKLTGSPVQGQTLTVVAGTWSSTPAATAYTWERCNANGRICTTIAGATSASYAVTAADVGHALVALVTVHAGSSTAAALSSASAAVKS